MMGLVVAVKGKKGGRKPKKWDVQALFAEFAAHSRRAEVELERRILALRPSRSYTESRNERPS